MRLLLDTHIFLWAITDDTRLSKLNQAAFLSPGHELLLSTGSLWEILLKNQTGKLPFPESAATYLPRQLRRNRVEVLNLNADHVYRLAELPPLHSDPFDRMLIAQALAENISIVTQDAMIRRYPVRCFS